MSESGAMTFTNFKLGIDSEGIAVVTWNAPGRTMNVIDMTAIAELSAERRLLPGMDRAEEAVREVLRRQMQDPGVGPLFSNPQVNDLDDLYQQLGGHLRWQDLRE